MRRWMLLAALAVPACQPPLDDRPSLVLEPVVVAVLAEPPEARPGDSVALSVVVATAEGPATAEAMWAFCTEPRPLTDSNSVAASCLENEATAIGGPAQTIEAVVPSDACTVFGPEAPPGNFRPRDPDPSGGFYQPIRVELDDGVAFGRQRLRCALANAPFEAAREYRDRYRNNANPTLGTLAISVGGDAIGADAIPAGAAVSLAIAWPDAAAERYVAYDLVERAVIERREVLAASWFITAGALASDRTATPSNTWTAPDASGEVHLWMVLRDDRGGAAWSVHTLQVVAAP